MSDRYLSAFAGAVPVFGRGQVSTYILAGLGDTAAAGPMVVVWTGSYELTAP